MDDERRDGSGLSCADRGRVMEVGARQGRGWELIAGRGRGRLAGDWLQEQ